MMGGGRDVHATPDGWLYCCCGWRGTDHGSIDGVLAYCPECLLIWNSGGQRVEPSTKALDPAAPKAWGAS